MNQGKGAQTYPQVHRSQAKAHQEALSGFLLVDKPVGITSHDVVEVIRRILRLRRVGHTGTLDPMAEGLLILLIGSATKRQQEFQAHDKVYQARLKLGAQTDTADLTGCVCRTSDKPSLTWEGVHDVIKSLIGPLSFTPPSFSAIKVHGRPSYWWRRRNQPVKLMPRTVQLYEASLEDLTPDEIGFRVRCSAGTYMRSVGEIIAERLGTLGHLSALKRLAIGEWMLEDAISVQWISEQSIDVITQLIRPLKSACAS